MCHEGKEDDAIHEYFKNPRSFAASFLISRQKKPKTALQIYHRAKNSSSLNLYVIITLFSVLGKKNERTLDSILDDLINEFYAFLQMKQLDQKKQLKHPS